MNGYRKPRRIRWPANSNTLKIAILRSTKFTAKEVEMVMKPVLAAHKAICEGVGSEWDWCQMASAMNISMSIEIQGVVRGIKEHIHCAELALEAIQQRANAMSEWHPTELHFDEKDYLQIAMELHKFQIQNLSCGEFRRALNSAEGRIRSQGGLILYGISPSSGARP